MRIGDTVSVLDENISGEIIAITGDLVTITDQDGFNIDYSKKELVIEMGNITANELSPHNLSEIILEKQSKKNTNSKKVKPKERKLPPMEVDLHIHQLTSSTRGMDNYDMLTLQLDTAKRQLEFAISKRIQRIVFIHGVGDGRLRADLEFLLNRYDNLEFYDADYQKYGVGATEVYIFQNKKA